MNTTRLTRMEYQRNRQSGYILIVSVMLLLVITLVTIAMGRGFFAEEGMAGNMRETVRAFTAAQSALSAAEATVKPLTLNSGVVCNAGTLSGSIPFTVCSNPVTINPFNQAANTGALANQPPTFATYTIYTGFPGTINSAGGQDTYYAPPVYYIYFLGGTGGNQIYQITAAGYGGNQNAVAIVRSNYSVTSPTPPDGAQ